MQPFTHDTWAPLAYIPELGTDAHPRHATWLDPVDSRRLTAYRVLAAYRDNVRRFFLPDEAWDKRVENVDGMIRVNKAQGSNVREYGDSALLVDTARALILGEDQSIEVEDTRTGEDLEPLPAAVWVTEWAERERLRQKLLQGEGDAVALGDSVYVLVPDAAKKRPRLRVYDPGFYFPDTTTPVQGWVEDDFPPIVHLAWEEEDEDGLTWVVRSTWQLRPLDEPAPTAWGGLAEWSCWFRKTRIRTDRLTARATVYSQEMAAPQHTTVVQDWTDLGIDFIPVVHVPNTPTPGWGDSILTRVGQILDDLQGTDTDLATGAQTSAAPTLVTESPVLGLTGRPGETLGVPGGASWTDTSRNLAAWTAHVETLLDRLALNTRLAQALLGRVQPNDVPSGVALQLGFHPARQLMREARTIRDEKYPLLLRFAYRMAQAYSWAAPGETPRMTVELGASLPADLAVAVDTVKNLLPVRGISTGTAVRILMRAGLPIEDAEAEVTAIRREMFKEAADLVDATGNYQAAAEMLGVPLITLPQVLPTDSA